nr:unnamed protein product [Callosobruchus chinensis]
MPREVENCDICDKLVQSSQAGLLDQGTAKKLEQPRRRLDLVYMNIRSLQNKLEDLQCFVKKEDCDVLLLTETWLKVNETFLYDIRNYKALHSCRDGRGGGASVYVKDTIRCCEISRSEPDSKINWLCVQLDLKR